MVLLQSVVASGVPSAKAFRFSLSMPSLLPPRNPNSLPSNVFKFFRANSSSPQHLEPITTNYAGVKLEEVVVDDVNLGKVRLDSWVSSRIRGISRARVQSSIKSGLVSVNGRVIHKVSYGLRDGDKVSCEISELQPLTADPEDIPLDIVYEDDHVLVVNKPPHMVVHPAPGNPSGTLVNGILHHCSLPNFGEADEEVLSDLEYVSGADEFSSNINGASVRPGIVHRIDKGTSGLLVVAKDEYSHAHLAEQFKQHTVERVYISLTCGVPSPPSGRIEVPIGRDSNNRIRMIAIPGLHNHGRARYAASRYKAIEIVAGGGSALVEWRLETGRTHQIRAHAKYLGIPLLGDDVYGGTKSMALSLLQRTTPPTCHGELTTLISGIKRPCLHALTLGFQHPYTLQKVHFYCPPPSDFASVLSQFCSIGKTKERVVRYFGTPLHPQMEGVSEFSYGDWNVHEQSSLTSDNLHERMHS